MILPRVHQAGYWFMDLRVMVAVFSSVVETCQGMGDNTVGYMTISAVGCTTHESW